MTAYTDYEYYTDTYLGTAITTESIFDRLALRASAVIDRITFQRAEDVTDEDDLDKIYMSCCAIADEMYSIEQGGGDDGIQSERTGNHSVTFAAGSKKSMSAMSRYIEAARLYLESTGLMFRGFADGEYGGYVDEDE